MAYDGKATVTDAASLQTYLNDHSPTQGAVLNIMQEIETGLTKQGWDQPPLLYMLRSNWLDNTHYGVEAELIGPIPDEASEQGGYGIALFLNIGASNLDSLLPPEALATVDGFVLVNEGWMLTIEPDDHEGRQRSLDHTIHLDPRRKEVRILIACDRSGATYSLTRVRDGDLSGRFDPTEPDEDDGQIPDGMRKLAAALGGPRARR